MTIKAMDSISCLILRCGGSQRNRETRVWAHQVVCFLVNDQLKLCIVSRIHLIASGVGPKHDAKQSSRPVLMVASSKHDVGSVHRGGQDDVEAHTVHQSIRGESSRAESSQAYSNSRFLVL